MDEEIKEKLTERLSQWFYWVRTWGLLGDESNEHFCNRHAKESMDEFINIINHEN